MMAVYSRITCLWPLLLLASVFEVNLGQQLLLSNMPPVSSVNGTTATLICNYSLINAPGFNLDSVRWFNSDDFAAASTLFRMLWNMDRTVLSQEYFIGYSEPAYVVTITGSMISLTIAEVRLDRDERIYGCQVQFINDRLDTAAERITAKLTVIVLPSFITLSDSTGVFPSTGRTSYLVVREDHKFTCRVPGIKPGASFIWTLGSRYLIEHTESNVTDDDGLTTSTSMTTLSATWGDHGETIMCRASNSDNHPGASISVMIDVIVPPRSSSMSLSDYSLTLFESAYVDEGASHTFTCSVQGTRPAVTIKWLIGGEAQQTVNQVSSETNGLSDTSGDLVVTPVRSNHRQELRCEAVNTVNTTGPHPSVAVTLDVTGPPDTPNINGNHLMTEGQASILTCTADMGYPLDWTLEWSNQGIPILDQPDTTSTLSDSSHRYSFTSMLEFTPKRQDNQHTIECIAKKSTRTTQPGTLGPINVQYFTNIINKEDVEVATKTGEDAVLTCKAKGNPEPVLTWYNPNNTEITSSGNIRKYKIETTNTLSVLNDTYGHVTISRLIIKAVDPMVDYGVYTCISVNSIGDPDSHHIILNRTRKPNSPTNVEITSRTPNSIAVSWTAGYDGGEEQWFYVSHKRSADSSDYETFSEQIDGGLTSYNVTGLKSYTQYEIRVYAENGVGRTPNPDSIVEYTLERNLEPSSSSSVAVIVGVIIGFVLLVIVILLAYFIGRKIRRRREEKTDGTSERKQERREDKGSPYEDILEMDIKSPDRDGNSTYSNLPRTNKDFPRDMLKIVKELGQGAFGQVFLAEANGIIKKSKITLVAVKTLKEGASQSDKEDLIRELDLMKKLPGHRNVVKLLGFSIEQDPPYIIVEYLSRGNLKDLLKDSRSKGGSLYGNLHGASESITSGDLMKFANDVADGMHYISSQKCIHRDLAARNVLVAEDMTCKVSDFGLARDVIDNRVYERKSEGRLPLRWMAMESILDELYTTKSDVWSFGVLLWEIVTLGARPYPTMSAKMMLNELRSGYRMPKPTHCQDELYEIMLKCWEEHPEKRPPFEAIADELQNLRELDKDYIVVTAYEENGYVVTIPDGEQEKC